MRTLVIWAVESSYSRLSGGGIWFSSPRSCNYWCRSNSCSYISFLVNHIRTLQSICRATVWVQLLSEMLRVDSLGGRVGDELNTLGDVALQTVVAGLEQLLLVVVCAADNVDRLLCTAGAKLNGYGEEVGAGGLCDGVTTVNTGQVDEAGLDNALLALGGLDDLLGESNSALARAWNITQLDIPVSSVGHGESGWASTLLGLDNLVTTELDTCLMLVMLIVELSIPLTVDERIKLVWGDVDAGLGLAEERHDGLARVSTDDGDVQVRRVLLAGDLGDKGLGTDDIEGGDTKELLGIEDTGLLEDLGGDWDGGVDRVGDDQDVCLGAVLGDTLNQTLDDAGVDLEEVVTGHAGLAFSVSACHTDITCGGLLTGNTSGDDHDISTVESLL